MADIPPQLDEGEIKRLSAFKEALERPTVYFSAAQLGINLVIGAGLKHMWKVINVLQFVVYFLVWKINVDPLAKEFIGQVKNLAFFEFLTDQIFDWINRSKLQCKMEGKCSGFI